MIFSSRMVSDIFAWRLLMQYVKRMKGLSDCFTILLQYGGCKDVVREVREIF